MVVMCDTDVIAGYDTRRHGRGYLMHHSIGKITTIEQRHSPLNIALKSYKHVRGTTPRLSKSGFPCKVCVLPLPVCP